MSEHEGVLVGTGSFLVDRGEALDKLMRFQLPEPAGFGLLLLRAAHASGASWFSAAANGSVLRLSFDGRPLTRDELSDPYRCLFEKRTPEMERNRLLAAAALSALRLQPSEFTVSSGRDGARALLHVRSIEREELGAADNGEDTDVRMRLPSSGQAQDVLRLLKQGSALSAVQVIMDGETLPGWREGGTERCHFERGGVRGWIAVPREPIKESALELHSHGALVERLALKLPAAQVEGAINDDHFVLNASQAGVVRDAAFRRVVESLNEPLRRLVAAQTSSVAGAMAHIGAIVGDSSMRAKWKDTLEAGVEGELGGLTAALRSASTFIMAAAGAGVEALARVESEARTVRWLRGLCLSRTRRAKTEAVEDLLWQAPLFLGADSAPLSLDDLAEQAKKLSYIPCSRNGYRGLSLPFKALWTLASNEARTVERLIGLPARDVTETVEQVRGAARRGTSATFEQAGLPPPLIRVAVSDGTIAGEVGLSAHPEKRGRLHLLTEGMPSGLIEDEGPLRYDAVVSDPGRRWERDPLTPRETELCERLLAGGRAQAAALYRRLAQELDPADVTARGAAVREHLLDYLLADVQARGPEAAADESSDASWAAGLPLFLSQFGPTTYARLSGELATSRPVYSARRAQESQWQENKLVIVGGQHDERFLSRLLPRHVAVPVRGRPGVFALVRRTGEPCPGKRCVFAFRLAGGVFHAEFEGKGAFAWEGVTVHAAPSSAERPVDLSGQDELAVELMAAVVRESGALADRPADPRRRLLLALLSQAPPPWPGAGGKALWTALKEKPFFRSPNTGGRSLEDVFAALHAAAGRLTYSMDGAASGPPGDLVVDERELAALKRLEPMGAGRLVPAGAPPRAAIAQAAPVEAPEPEPSSFLSVFRGKSLIKPQERFFIERRYQSAGLDVWLGVPARLPAPKPAYVPRGEADENLAALPPLAQVLVDAAARPPGAPPILPAVVELMGLLYEELAARWPVGKRSSENLWIAQRYFLEVAALSSPGRPLAGWRSLRRKVMGLKLFECTDGGWISLDELKEAAAEAKGVLRFADPGDRRALEGGPAPELRYPKIVAELLGAKPRRAREARPAAAAGLPEKMPPLPGPMALDDAEPPEPAPPERAEVVDYALAAEQPAALGLAHRILLGLRGRKGLRLPKHELSELKLGRSLPQSPLSIDSSGAWILDEEHPMVASILGSPLSPEEQAPFLASVAYTASNRIKNQVTDDDDIRFHEALTAAL